MLWPIEGEARGLELGWSPRSDAALYLLHYEEARFAFVVLLVGPHGESPYPSDFSEAPAILHARGVLQCVSGYPNDEAWENDPRLQGCSPGFYEILESPWRREVTEYNNATYWVKNQRAVSGWTDFPGPVRHFFIGSHEGSVQLLAEGVALQTFPGRSHRWCVDEAIRRHREEYATWAGWEKDQ